MRGCRGKVYSGVSEYGRKEQSSEYLDVGIGRDDRKGNAARREVGSMTQEPRSDTGLN